MKQPVYVQSGKNQESEKEERRSHSRSSKSSSSSSSPSSSSRPSWASATTGDDIIKHCADRTSETKFSGSRSYPLGWAAAAAAGLGESCDIITMSWALSRVVELLENVAGAKTYTQPLAGDLPANLKVFIMMLHFHQLLVPFISQAPPSRRRPPQVAPSWLTITDCYS